MVEAISAKRRYCKRRRSSPEMRDCNMNLDPDVCNMGINHYSQRATFEYKCLDFVGVICRWILLLVSRPINGDDLR